MFMPLSDLPLYQEDYIGLRALNESGRLHRLVCKGQHMEISDDCWETVMEWLVPAAIKKEESFSTPHLRFQMAL